MFCDTFYCSQQPSKSTKTLQRGLDRLHKNLLAVVEDTFTSWWQHYWRNYLYDNHDADLCSTFSMWHYLLILCVISSFGFILNQKTECDCSEWMSNYLCLIGIRTDPFFSLYKLAYQWRVVVSYSSYTFQYCTFCWLAMRWWILILQN